MRPSQYPTPFSSRNPDLLARLSGVRRSGRGWIAQCPAHDDDHPSLKIDIGANGRLLLYCFTGCRFTDILAKLDGRPHHSPVTRGRVVRLYDRGLRADVRDLYAQADQIRADRRHVERLRHAATQMGDCPAAWELLDLAAELERDLWLREWAA